MKNLIKLTLVLLFLFLLVCASCTKNKNEKNCKVCTFNACVKNGIVISNFRPSKIICDVNSYPENDSVVVNINGNVDTTMIVSCH